MYHKVSANGIRDFLTVSSDDLKAQFRYLQENGYNSIHLSELINYVSEQTPLPPKPVLITFDDGYSDNYNVMYPLLKKYGLKASIFLVPCFLKSRESNNKNGNEYLTVDEIFSMNPQVVEFGLHSYDHKNYKELDDQELADDLQKCKNSLSSLGIKFQPCLAFPYGSYPKKKTLRQKKFFKTLQNNQIKVAFRIGNRINALPVKNPLLIQRLDIRGDESLKKFIKKLKFGKSIISVF